jgi:hypothetical protein
MFSICPASGPPSLAITPCSAVARRACIRTQFLIWSNVTGLCDCFLARGTAARQFLGLRRPAQVSHLIPGECGDIRSHRSYLRGTNGIISASVCDRRTHTVDNLCSNVPNEGCVYSCLRCVHAVSHLMRMYSAILIIINIFSIGMKMHKMQKKLATTQNSATVRDANFGPHATFAYYSSSLEHEKNDNWLCWNMYDGFPCLGLLWRLHWLYGYSCPAEVHSIHSNTRSPNDIVVDSNPILWHIIWGFMHVIFLVFSTLFLWWTISAAIFRAKSPPPSSKGNNSHSYSGSSMAVHFPDTHQKSISER